MRTDYRRPTTAREARTQNVNVCEYFTITARLRRLAVQPSLYSRQDELAHYHRRSDAESAFSMMKRVFTETLHSKTTEAQTNEWWSRTTSERWSSRSLN